MAMVRKVLAGTLIFVLPVASVGYGLAFQAKKDCLTDTSRDLVARHVKGFTMEKAVDTADIPITSRVAWPFVVDVYYSVPWGMHAAMSRNRYTVFPWGSKKVSHKVEYSL
ncbi:hypothetical protein [Dyella choica]|uniref:Uncharacterized protein n=1 Tax=Dyella choica TaxID=1927959 RepID=A0A432LZ58_9GAMM|nr:hypothetical protein [Dyella choica]RUL67699.1 hypothetical protein EKH80_23660 [Dyella choica]